MNLRPPLITVGELKLHLEVYSDDCELDFSGLDFYRLKSRGEKYVQVEFNQTVGLQGDGAVTIFAQSGRYYENQGVCSSSLIDHAEKSKPDASIEK
jgi:hypothetical protein